MHNSKTSIKSGYWVSTGGNPFWINVIGDEVFWLGMNQKSEEIGLGGNWCHIGHGKINNNRIKLSWSDMPVGKDKLNGKIIIEIVDATHMKVIVDSGGFGKSDWSWLSQSKSISELVSS